MEIESKKAGELTPIGTFEVDELKKLIISDPAYDADTWCNGKVNFARKGTWHAFIDHVDTGCFGMRNYSLVVIHEEYVLEVRPNYTLKEWRLIPDCIGVDSGQCGIFNAKHFKNDELARTYPPKQRFFPIEAPGSVFYNECCMITLNLDYEVSQGLSAGVVPGGAVSEAGFGDGIYPAYCLVSSAGEVIAVFVEFITHDVLEDCDYDFNDDDDGHE